MTPTITATQVKDLRTMTGAPMMDCKAALKESDGDIEKASEWLRKKGIAKAAKKAGREATEGLVSSYIHHNGRVGVLLEVNCETDFVAKTDPFKDFCKEISLHIASMKPSCLSREDVPAALVEKEKEILRSQIDSSKPAEIQEKMLEGRLSKYFAEQCLMEQPWVKDDKKTIEQLRAEMVGTLGENIQIGRFARFEIGS
ncbi:MAG: translation elongation factor Ts [Planctomycetota bacterium]|nr:MAG: translation elongation factor Ts [Planctomycetota bacterium]